MPFDDFWFPFLCYLCHVVTVIWKTANWHKDHNSVDLNKIILFSKSHLKKLIFIVFFSSPFSPFILPTPSNHHTVVHVHESFFLFARLLHPAPSCHPALHLWVFFNQQVRTTEMKTKLNFSIAYWLVFWYYCSFRKLKLNVM